MRFGVYFLSIYSKEKNTTQDQKAVGAGDAWTGVGIDADTKLVVSWFVGSRDADSANIFMNDVATRLKNRVQLTTDGSALINDYRNIFKLIQFSGVRGAPHRLQAVRPSTRLAPELLFNCLAKSILRH